MFTDKPAPQRVIRKLREADIQSRCVAFARSRKWWARKFSSPSQRSVPDYLFAFAGRKLAVEFKAPGKTSTDSQKEEQEAMRKTGWIVFEDIGTRGDEDIKWFKAMIVDFESEERW